MQGCTHTLLLFMVLHILYMCTSNDVVEAHGCSMRYKLMVVSIHIALKVNEMRYKLIIVGVDIALIWKTFQLQKSSSVPRPPQLKCLTN